MGNNLKRLLMMSLPERLIDLRKERNLTQASAAELIGIHVNSLKKYEAGQAQPSLDVLKKIAVAFHVSSDFLLFDVHERKPNDDLALKLEAVEQMPENEQSVIREVLDSLIIKYQTRRWDSTRGDAQ